MTVEYDGSRYQGWQRQKLTHMTIQEIIEHTVSDQAGYPVEVSGSGRTDAGVHAKGQVVSFQLSGKADETGFIRRLNENLPDDIRVRSMELVKSGFHARYKAKGKRYCYRIDTRERADVFLRKYHYSHPEKLDIRKMEEASSFLTGTFDYTSFTDKKDEKTAVRIIWDIEIVQAKCGIEIYYTGSGFMYHMVRILTGTLLEVGEGKIKPEDIPGILDAKDRSLAGFLAPAHGLYLEEVYYDKIKEKEVRRNKGI